MERGQEVGRSFLPRQTRACTLLFPFLLEDMDNFCQRPFVVRVKEPTSHPCNFCLHFFSLFLMLRILRFPTCKKKCFPLFMLNPLFDRWTFQGRHPAHSSTDSTTPFYEQPLVLAKRYYTGCPLQVKGQSLGRWNCLGLSWTRTKEFPVCLSDGNIQWRWSNSLIF